MDTEGLSGGQESVLKSKQSDKNEPVTPTLLKGGDKKGFILLQPSSTPVSLLEGPKTSEAPSEISSSVTKSPATSSSSTTVTNGLGGKFLQVTNNNQCSGASIYMGTLYKNTKGKECLPKKVLLTPLKGKDGSVTRLLLPRQTSSPPTASITPTSSSPALSVVLPHVPGKQLSKSYVVSPKGGTSLLNRTPVNVDNISIRNTPTPLKTYTPNIIRQKHHEKGAQPSVLKQYCQVSSVSNLTSKAQTPINSVIDKPVLTHASPVSVTSTVKLASLPKLLPAAKIGSSSLLISNSNISKIALASLPPPKPSSTLPVTQSATFTLITPPVSSSSACISISDDENSDSCEPVVSSTTSNVTKDQEEIRNEKALSSTSKITKKVENEPSNENSDCRPSSETIETSVDVVKSDENPSENDKNKSEHSVNVNESEEASVEVEIVSQRIAPTKKAEQEERRQVITKKQPLIDPEIVTIDDDSDLEEVTDVPPVIVTPPQAPPPVVKPPQSSSTLLKPPQTSSIVMKPSQASPIVLKPFQSSPVVATPQESSLSEGPSLSSTEATPSSSVASTSEPSPPQSPPLPAPKPSEPILIKKPAIISNGHLDSSNRRSLIKSDKTSSSSINKVLAPPTAVVERAQKRKAQLLVTTPAKKPCPNQQIDNFKMLPGAEDFDPCKVIEWEASGIGKLPSSEIRLILNDYGMIEVLDYKNIGIHKQQSFAELQDFSLTKKDRDAEEIFCCISCGCYGLLTEFYNENYCSLACRHELIARQEAFFKKRELEIEKETLAKKRKKFLMGLRKLDDSNSLPDDIFTKKRKGGSDSSKEDDSNYEDTIDLDDDSSDVSVVSKQSKPEKPPPVEAPKPKPVKKKMKTEKSVKAPADTSNETTNQKTKLRPRDIVVVAADSDCEDKDDEPSNEKAPTYQRDQEFPWAVYLAVTQCKPAWVKLFQNPFPAIGNSFRKGHKLEAIDPEHQSYFCVVTVVEKLGYRINLHFDGYSDKYNFWVNVDSPNIFPCGFASKHGIQLQPPFGIPPNSFSWSNYNSSCKSRNAPVHCFPNYRSTNTAPNLFAVGMKLEAVDKRNCFLVCVATVAAVMDDRILVHFDSWGDMYDYWADTSSPYIHPVGWCKLNNHHLTPPLGHKASTFSWEKYLIDTGSVAAPTRAFRLRPHIEFKKGTKIEAIDKRAPHLLRVATIKEVLPYQIKVCFDGFPDHFGYWVDDDCPDIHPIGWGSRTGHPLEPPPKDDLDSPCPTPGCIGQGHVNAQMHQTHSDVKDCPYSLDNLRNDHILEDRFSNKPSECDRDARSNEEVDVDKDDSDSEGEDDIGQIRWKWLEMQQMLSKQGKSELSGKTHSSLWESPLAKPLSEIAKHVEDVDNPLSWNPSEVTDFVNRFCINKTGIFLKQDIDGEAFLMLQKKDLTNVLSLKMGDAVKVHHSILLLREKVT